MIQLWQRMFWKCFILKLNFLITFADERSVLLISAEHCRIQKPAGFQVVTCQVDNLCKFLVFNE